MASSPKRAKTATQSGARASTTAGYMMKMPPLADKRSVAEQLCQTCSGPIYSQGLETFQVPMALYEINRARVVQSMLESDASARGLILLEGGKQTTRYDTDHEPVFRQESYFHYLFGASQYSDCYGVLTLPEGEATLFVPTWGVDTETVCGPSPEFERVKEELGLERVLGVSELPSFVEREMKRLGLDNESEGAINGDGPVDNGNEEKKNEASAVPKLFLLKGLNTDSGNFATPASFDGIEKFKDVRDEDALFGCIAECRVTKVCLLYLALVCCACYSHVSNKQIGLFNKLLTIYHIAPIYTVASRDQSTKIHQLDILHGPCRGNAGVQAGNDGVSTRIPLPTSYLYPWRMPPHELHLHLRLRAQWQHPSLRPCRQAKFSPTDFLRHCPSGHGGRISLLCIGHHVQFPRQWYVHQRSARRLRIGLGGSSTCHEGVEAGRVLDRDAP